MSHILRICPVIWEEHPHTHVGVWWERGMGRNCKKDRIEEI